MHHHITSGKDVFTIRQARVSDAGPIAELFLVSSDGLAAYIWERDRAEGVALLDHGTNRYARTGTAFSFENCLVAEVEGRVVGMLHAFVLPDRAGEVETDPVLKPYSELEIIGSVYVSGVAVLEAWRGKGIGSALLEQAETQAIKHNLVSLICFESNARAMRLYRSRNYAEVSRRALVPHPTLTYSNGDAVLLAKRVPPSQ